MVSVRLMFSVLLCSTFMVNFFKKDTGAFEASEIAALMVDKRLWKDLVVARLRATK